MAALPNPEETLALPGGEFTIWVSGLARRERFGLLGYLIVFLSRPLAPEEGAIIGHFWHGYPPIEEQLVVKGDGRRCYEPVVATATFDEERAPTRDCENQTRRFDYFLTGFEPGPPPAWLVVMATDGQTRWPISAPLRWGDAPLIDSFCL